MNNKNYTQSDLLREEPQVTKSKPNFSIDRMQKIYSVKHEDGSTAARFFDAREAIGFCRTIRVTVLNACEESVDIIWINGSARILGPEIRGEFVSPSSIPPAK